MVCFAHWDFHVRKTIDTHLFLRTKLRTRFRSQKMVCVCGLFRLKIAMCIDRKDSTDLLPTSLNYSPNSLYPSMYRQPFAIIRLLASQGLGIRNHLRRSAEKRSADQLREMWRLYRSRCKTKLINVRRKWIKKTEEENTIRQTSFNLNNKNRKKPLTVCFKNVSEL